MTVRCKKLYKLLIDKGIKKDLRLATNLSLSLMSKLGRNENMTTDVLAHICKTLSYDVGDIMEMLPDEEM